MTLGVRAIVEDEAGAVLLVRHTYIEGLYLPGGGVERGEPALHALDRELIEEAGIMLTTPPDLIGMYSNHKYFRNDHVLLYRANTWQPTPATSQGEISEIVWANPHDLPKDATPATCRRMAEYYDGQSQNVFW